MSVADVCESIERAIGDRFPDEVWIRGSISGLNRSGAGHVYFDLVEPGELGHRPSAVLPVALFAKAKFRVNAILRKSNAIRMDDGIEIRIRGRLTYYGAQSRVQLVMSLIDPAFTLGQLEMARGQLLAKLTTEGLLDANRRLTMPVLPLHVVVITSVSSAAEADFIDELRLSGLAFEVEVIDSRVQGSEAVAMLVAAIDEAATRCPDVIAIVRGGGARTDLVAFDHEAVARAIAGCAIPVFVGIGHDTDRSVADHVAHLSTKTPTACAAAIVDRVRDFDRRVRQARDRLVHLAETALERERYRLDASGVRIGQVAGAAVERQAARLDLLGHRTEAASARGLERAAHRLDRSSYRIDGLDPARTLARGWSITRTDGGALVRSPDDAPSGTSLVTTLAEGTITSRVGDAP